MSTAAPKIRYPRALAISAAKEICDVLKPHCERLIVAGSLRRRKESVGDIEILYVPKLEVMPQMVQADLLAPPPAPQFRDLAECQINAMAGYFKHAVTGVPFRAKNYLITQRRNATGHVTWGEKNKYAVHIRTQIPVDFFKATAVNWWNYLVCRTGSAENNIRISEAAQKKGWKWHPYDAGFTDERGKIIPATSEQDVFALAGLEYREPKDR